MNGMYAEQWKKLRGIHRRFLLSFLIGPIGWLIILFAFDPKDHHTGLVLIYVIVWVLFGAWTSYQFTHFSLPPVRAPVARGIFLAGRGPVACPGAASQVSALRFGVVLIL